MRTSGAITARGSSAPNEPEGAVREYGGEARGAVVVAETGGGGEGISEAGIGKRFGIKLVEFGRAGAGEVGGIELAGQSSGAIKPTRRRNRSNG